MPQDLTRGETLKTAFLQLTPNFLVLTPVRKAGRQHSFHTPLSFPLPEKLRGPGREAAQPHEHAVFAANCMRGTVLEGSALVVCLDANAAVTKEYRHLPAKDADLRRFAVLEAGTVVRDDPGGYDIATREYGYAEASTGRLKAVLFAAPKSFSDDMAQEFRRQGIRVLKIVPLLSGMMTACRASLGMAPGAPAWRGKTVAVVDAGFENLRVALFTDGTPVFLKEFDSVWQEVLETLHGTAGCGYEEALREMKRPGFLLSGGNASFEESVTSLVGTLLETASAEVVRNLRLVLSAERLTLQQIVFCGALASHPDFSRYVDGLALDVPHETAEEASKRYRAAVAVEAEASVQGSRPGDFFTLSGMLAPHGAVDFLELEKGRRGSLRFNRSAVALLCVAAVAVMAVEPIVYRNALAQRAKDQVALAAPKITEVRNLQAEKGRLQDRLAALEEEKKLLPAQKSKMETAVAKLQEQLVPRVVSLQSCQISGSAGTVTVSFTAASFAQFNSAMKSVADSGYFEVSAPYAIAKDAAAGGYRCSASFRIRGFEPAVPAGGTPSAASGTLSAASSGGGT